MTVAALPSCLKRVWPKEIGHKMFDFGIVESLGGKHFDQPPCSAHQSSIRLGIGPSGVVYLNVSENLANVPATKRTSVVPLLRPPQLAHPNLFDSWSITGSLFDCPDWNLACISMGTWRCTE